MTNNKLSKVNIVVFILLVAGLITTLGMISGIYKIKVEYKTTDDVINEIKSIYNEYSLHTIDNWDEQFDGSIKGFAKATGDKYCKYLNPKEAAEYFNSTGDESTGFGMELIYEKSENIEGYYIITVYKESDAENKGIKAGDYVIGINGETIDKIGKDELFKRLKDTSITSANLIIQSGENIKEIKTNIGKYKQSSVTSNIIDDIMYIKISKFSRTTADEIKQVKKEAIQNNIDKFIFDVRSNLGGYTNIAAEALDSLVPKGMIVKIVDKNGKEFKYLSDTNELNGKMVILTDKNTASAAELFTISLKEYKNAIVIGETTYGKGTELTLRKLRNGGVIVVSSGLYYTNSGENIEGKGITPDIYVQMSDEHKKILYRLDSELDEQLKEAINTLKK